MKKILLMMALLLPSVVLAAPNNSIMFEIGVGFGGSGKVTKTKEQLANKYNNKFCYHRPQGRMVYGAIRYRYDRAEAHVARWFGESDTARCDRDSWAAGLGYVFDTQDINANGVDDYYATYTPGIAYTWGKNKNFNVQDNTNTNWRLKDNWQMYNRVAVGGGNKDWMGEVAVVRYGLPIVDYERKGENFMTVTVGARDWESEKPNAPDGFSDRGLTPPPVIGDNTLIVNNGVESGETGNNNTNNVGGDSNSSGNTLGN